MCFCDFTSCSKADFEVSVVYSHPQRLNLLLICVDGGKNPIFQEKFVFTLIEGLQELNVVVWNSNTLCADDFIGTGRYLVMGM